MPKKIIPLYFSLSCATRSIGSGWEKGFYKTTNGGADWTELPVTIGEGGIFDLAFIDSQTGVGCGLNADWTESSFIKTTDGGNNWSEVSTTATELMNPTSISFPSQNIGYISGHDGAWSKSLLIKTTDGGTTWTVKKSDFPISNSFCFADNSVGYVVGDGGYISKTTNGGDTWNTLTSSTTKNLQSVSFYSSNLGVVCGSEGTVIKTTDGGNSWSDISTGNTSKTLYKIKLVSPVNILTCGSGGSIYLSNNSGSSWQDQSVGGSDLRSISLAGGLGWIMGSSGAIYKGDAPLPVELTSFTASASNGIISLNWQTANEINNFGFEVERKLSDKSDWENIGFVSGNGNSNSLKEYSFTDPLDLNLNLKYRLKQIDTDGKFEYSKEISVETDLSTPKEFALSQNYPNPFNPTTTIEFSLPTDRNVEIKVYNTLGVEVSSVLNGYRKAGLHKIEFNANKLASGIYYYKIISGSDSQIKKMILMR